MGSFFQERRFAKILPFVINRLQFGVWSVDGNIRVYYTGLFTNTAPGFL